MLKVTTIWGDDNRRNRPLQCGVRRRVVSAMIPGTKKEALRHVSFGNQVAEEEQDSLQEYFVRTQAWERIYNGEIDIIYGPKRASDSG